jgi:hypothetical protein
MKKLRNFYFILGLAALAFALLAKNIPGVTITDFVLGFCHGLAITSLVAGAITSSIPYLYRTKPKETVKEHKKEGEESTSETI